MLSFGMVARRVPEGTPVGSSGIPHRRQKKKKRATALEQLLPWNGTKVVPQNVLEVL